MKTILCPIDFSESSEAAMDLAVAMAQSRGSRLLLFHVDPPPSLATKILGEERHRALQREHTEWLEAQLAHARMRLRDETEIEAITRVSKGKPAQEILAVAGEHDVELIVMSTHSSAVRRVLLGSVAANVAQAAPCPVLLVRDYSFATVPFDNALLCLDFSSASDRVAEVAQDVCLEDASFELLHVVDEPSVAALQLSLGERQEVLSIIDTLHRDATMRLGEYAASLPLTKNSPAETVRGGPIATTIVTHAAETKAGLIVVGSHEPRGVREKLLGTVAERVLQTATQPVLLVPSRARSRG